MRFLSTLVALASLMSALVSPAHAELSQEDKVIRLSSLEWPPYSGADLPEQGATIAVVRAALAEMGYELEVTFFPWSRAVNLAADAGSGFHGYFPEYYSDEVSRTFRYSDPVGYGPLGFVQSVGSDIEWSSLTELDRYVIGTVKDYVNTKEFDSLVESRSLSVSEALNDTSNLLKVAYRRIDMAVVDQNVMKFLLSDDPDLRRISGEIEFNPKLLDMKSLYVCFSLRNRELAEILNQGLASIDVNAIQEAYFARLEAASGASLSLRKSPLRSAEN